MEVAVRKALRHIVGRHGSTLFRGSRAVRLSQPVILLSRSKQAAIPLQPVSSPRCTSTILHLLDKTLTAASAYKHPGP